MSDGNTHEAITIALIQSSLGNKSSSCSGSYAPGAAIHFFPSLLLPMFRWKRKSLPSSSRSCTIWACQADWLAVSSQRPNVVCHIPGSGKTEKTLILTTHMDTVEPSDYTRDPWGAQIEEGRLYGVGAADAKAQIAAFVYAVYALRQAGITLAGGVTLAFVVDEEPGACSPYGTRYLLEQGLLQGDAAIIGEPGNHKIAIGHRGIYRFRLQIKGEATHTGVKAWEQRRQRTQCHPRHGTSRPGSCRACTAEYALSSIPQSQVRPDLSHPHSRGKRHQCGSRLM